MAGRFKGLALTFDDILLEPAASSVLPAEVKVSTNLTQKIKLNIPILSAAMDTVTGSSMAIALARLGGIGVIHRNLSIEEQVQEVRKVKRSESGMVSEPVTLPPEATLAEAKQLMSLHNISGIPIVNGNKLKGIITQRDLRLETDLKKRIGDTMTSKNLITANSDVTLEEAENLLKENKIEKLPIVDSVGNLKGLITWRDLSKLREYPLAVKDGRGRLLAAASIGVGEEMLQRATVLVKEGADILVIDTAHAHHKNVTKAVPILKKAFPKVQLIVGNIATKEAAVELIKRGADAIKVGIGAGSICTTRDVAGVGVPQFTAILECASVAKKYKIPVIADGGLVYPADIVKAIAAGASSVMLGSMIAGTDETPGDIMVTSDGRRYKKYRGMGSYEALQARSNDRYFSKEVPEGISAKVPYKGLVSSVIKKLVASLRIGMGYYGASKIEDLWKTKYSQVTTAGQRESHPHDVIADIEEETFH
jgi:IMP dehydrogenase